MGKEKNKMVRKLAPVLFVVIISLVIFAYNFTIFAQRVKLSDLPIGTVQCGNTIRIYEDFAVDVGSSTMTTVTVSDYCDGDDSVLESVGTSTSTFVTIPDGNTITRSFPKQLPIELQCNGSNGFCIYVIEVD
jgi:hypothetical protein